MASEGLHEPIEKLKPETVDIHRAIVSLMEELEAIDWYRQRVDAASDPELSAVLAHNMNEEIEHASMTLEWIRRRVPKFDEALKTYLFTSGDITKIEEAVENRQEPRLAGREPSNNRTTIGDMKGN
ncbi:MAG: ferritin [Deltaproteobacteria bacterium]|nr:ferritin [Deltaproteobacteria bacterium]